MGENTQAEKKTPKRSPITGETIWFALPALGIVAFFVWVLSEMGSQSSGPILVSMLLGIAATLGGGGLLFLLLTRLGRTRR